ncbi:MAG: glycosyltransferase [Oscillospiraceae bacterium]|nr:glycosyltransferase [Oscillospiraceae bacterium]
MKVSVVIPVYNQESLIERAIRSIPLRDDIEIIVVDDGSTDDTWNKLVTIGIELNDPNFIVLHNRRNMGVGYTVNRGLDIADGEYIVLLGSDDYFYTDEFLKAMEQLDGTDLVYFDLKVNDGSIFKLTEESKRNLCGSTKFMRKEFVGDTRNPDIRQAEDWFFYGELLKKNPTERFTNLLVKHYNFPRKGSLTDIAVNGNKE